MNRRSLLDNQCLGKLHIRLAVFTAVLTDNPIAASMPELPPEIICTIVDEFDADKPEDRKTLRSLLFATKQMNSFALRALYQEISFVRLTFDEQVLGKLSALARDVESNPGLPFTTTFLCILGRGYKAVETYWDEINRNIGRIIPFLVNLRRMAICFQDGPADTRILRSLPSSAPLTHLRLEECSLSCEDLLRFLRCRPTLKWLDVCTRGQTQMTSGSGLPSDVLPHLTSLSLAYADIGIIRNLFSLLVTLTLHTFMAPIDGAGMIRRSMAPFALITACYLPAIDIAIIVPIVTSLPRLEYLWVEPAFVRVLPS